VISNALSTLDSTNMVEVVARIQADDDAACALLYAATIRGLRWQAYRKTGDNEAASDLAHDAFTATLIAIKREQLRDPEKAVFFMQSTLRRLSAGWIRTKIKERRLQREGSMPGTPAAGHHCTCERRTIAQDALSQLRDRDRDILVRFYLLEQSQDTICRELQLTRTQFRLLKSRAKARFAELGASVAQTRQTVTPIRETHRQYFSPALRAS
jgi:RNA polymerase sigma-70 factor, ECF subfamily